MAELRGLHVNHSVWAGALALMLAGQQQAVPQQAIPNAPQAIPDAPRPQTTLPKIPSVAPGMGSTGESTSAGKLPAVQLDNAHYGYARRESPGDCGCAQRRREGVYA